MISKRTAWCRGGEPRWLIRAAGPAVVLATVALAVTACGATKSGGGGNGKPLPGIREFGFNDQQFNAHVEKTQALIARCMAAAGFEYIPVDVKSVEAAQARVRKDPGYTRRSYKEKWGYGITTRLDDPVREIGMGPNLRIFNNLPQADKVAYSRTLWGENPREDFVFAFDEEDFSTTGGCTRRAVAKVFAPAQLKGTYVNPKDVLVDSDRRFVSARRKWSKCMRGHGYEYKFDQDEIIEEYEDAFDELTHGDDPRTLTGSRLNALHRLQAAEIKVSLADLDCQIKYTDDVERKVEIEVYGQPLEAG
jgi:hypothetical protein